MRSLLVLAVVGALFLLAEDEPRRERAASRSPLADALLVRLHVGGGLSELTPGFGDVWADGYGREEVVRLEGRSGRVKARIPLGRRVALAVGDDSVWALRWGGRFYRRPDGPLHRIDPATNRVVDRIPLRAPSGRPVFGFGVLEGGGRLWVWGPDRVLRLDPSSGRIEQEVAVGRRHGELTGAVTAGSDLLASRADGGLVRFDEHGAQVAARAPALAGAQLLAVAGRRAIAANAGALLAADARTGRLLWRQPLGFHVSTVLESGGVLLTQGAAFRDPGDRLWALEPATGRVVASMAVPSFGTTSMAEAGDALWIATGGGEVIVVPPLLRRLLLAAT